MSTHVTITLTHSLARDSRTNLETWLEEAETLARNLCPQHDPTGALTLVATDQVWNDIPVNLANRAQVLAGTHPPAYRARPTWDIPAQHSGVRRSRRCVDVQAGASAAHGLLYG